MYCKCGCGKKTSIVERSRYTSYKHYVKGSYYDYCHGHQKCNNDRINGCREISQNTIFIKTNNGMELESRVIVEKILNKKLKSTEVVHHLDRNRCNNKNNNLVACENQAYHLYLHQRMRIRRENEWLTKIVNTNLNAKMHY